MGWFRDGINWVKDLWRGKTASSVANYSYQTITHCFDQIAVIPKVVHSVVTHPPTRMVAKHLAYITVFNVIPLVCIRFWNQLLQERGQEYLEENQDPAWISTYTAIQMGLYLLQTATWAIKVNRQTEMMVRMAMVTLEATPMLNGAKTTLPMTVCTDPPEPCSTLRFMQGSIRDLAAYWATEAAISLTGYIPIAGGSISTLLSVYHNGRYVLTIVLPDLCNRHQMIYLSEHSELALSLGVGHAISSRMVCSFVEAATGIPPVFYNSAVKQLMLITQMSVAAHMNLPVAKKASTRSLVDPIDTFQRGVGFIVDILLLGLKSKIPRMMKGNDPKNLKEIFKQFSRTELSYLDWIDKKTHAKTFLRILFPRLVHGTDGFIKDPIIRSNWPTVRASVVDTLKIIEFLHEHSVVKAAAYAPKAAASMVASIFGGPKFIAEIVLKLLADEDLIAQLRSWRYQIEKFDVVVPKTSVRVDDAALLLSGQTQMNQAPPRKPVAEVDSVPLPKADKVIRQMSRAHQADKALPAVQEVVRRRPILEGRAIPPSRVIRFHPLQPGDSGTGYNPFDDHQEDINSGSANKRLTK